MKHDPIMLSNFSDMPMDREWFAAMREGEKPPSIDLHRHEAATISLALFALAALATYGILATPWINFAWAWMTLASELSLFLVAVLFRRDRSQTWVVEPLRQFGDVGLGLVLSGLLWAGYVAFLPMMGRYVNWAIAFTSLYSISSLMLIVAVSSKVESRRKGAVVGGLFLAIGFCAFRLQGGGAETWIQRGVL